MKVSEIMTIVNGNMDHSLGDKFLLNKINELETSIYINYLKELDEDAIDLVADQANYTMTGYKFEDILSVNVNSVEYYKRSILYTEGKVYYKKNGQIYIYPTPTAASTGGLVIVYYAKPATKLIANIATDELSLCSDFGERLSSIYEYYLYREISIFQEEITRANNWKAEYDTVFGEFMQMYINAQPHVVGDYRKKYWR